MALPQWPSHSCPVLPCPGGAIHTSSSRRRCSSSWLVPVSPSPAGLPAPGASATLSDIAAGGTRITSGSLPAPGPGTWPEAPAGPARPGPLLPGFGCPQPRPCAVSPAGESWAEEGDGASKDPKARVLTPPHQEPQGPLLLPTPFPGAQGRLLGPGMSSTPGTGSSSSPGAPGCAAPPGPAPASAPRPRSAPETGTATGTGSRGCTGQRDRNRHQPRGAGPCSPPGYRDMQPPRG